MTLFQGMLLWSLVLVLFGLGVSELASRFK